jgi:hypothetical protein
MSYVIVQTQQRESQMKTNPEDLNDVGFCIEAYDAVECVGCPADEESEGSKNECCGKVNVRKNGGTINDTVSDG